MNLTPRRLQILIAVVISLTAIVMFQSTWYIVAVHTPTPFQGMVMVTAALVIAFVAARIIRGKPMMSIDPGPKPSRLAVALGIAALIAIWTVPLLIMYLLGWR